MSTNPTDPTEASRPPVSGPGESNGAPRENRPRTDGPSSMAGADLRTLTALGRSLPYEPEPITGMHIAPRHRWLVPVGIALVTGLVVFAIGGVVVRGWRSAESPPVVTTADIAPAAAAPSGAPLSEVTRPKPAASSAEPAAKPTQGGDAPPVTHEADDPSASAHTRSPAARSTTPRARADHGTGQEQNAEPDSRKSTADYLPGTL